MRSIGKDSSRTKILPLLELFRVDGGHVFTVAKKDDLDIM